MAPFLEILEQWVAGSIPHGCNFHETLNFSLQLHFSTYYHAKIQKNNIFTTILVVQMTTPQSDSKGRWFNSGWVQILYSPQKLAKTSKFQDSYLLG